MTDTHTDERTSQCFCQVGGKKHLNCDISLLRELLSSFQLMSQYFRSLHPSLQLFIQPFIPPPAHLLRSSVVCRFLWRLLAENISPPAPPSVTPDEASHLGFAQPGCDLMPAPSLSPAECSGSNGGDRQTRLLDETRCKGNKFSYLRRRAHQVPHTLCHLVSASILFICSLIIVYHFTCTLQTWGP